MAEYRKYNLNLDPNDKDDIELIRFLESKHGAKRKNSYSAILREALLLLKARQKSVKGC